MSDQSFILAACAVVLLIVGMMLGDVFSSKISPMECPTLVKRMKEVEKLP